MGQGLDAGDLGPDLALGERLRLALAEHPGLDSQQALNLVRDLMGETDSLFPALKVLATQPSFGELLRAPSGPAARPHLDAVLAFASQMLAPAVVQRLEVMLSAATGLAPADAAGPPSTGLPVSLKAPPPSVTASHPGTVMASRDGSQSTEPGTVMATNLRSMTSAPAAKSSAQGDQPTGQALQASLRTVLLVLVALFGVYGLLRSPWLCESFDLCNTNDAPATPAKPAPDPATPTKSKALPKPVVPRAGGQSVAPPVVLAPSPRTPAQQAPSKEPASDPDGPLWP